MGRGGEEIANVIAGGKYRFVAGDDDRAHAILVLGEGVGEPVIHVPGERVFLLWTVDGDETDRSLIPRDHKVRHACPLGFARLGLAQRQRRQCVGSSTAHTPGRGGDQR